MARANYLACFAFLQKWEGGNTDTPGDRGGRTGRGGVTHTVYDAYRARKGLPKRDVFLITDAEIAEITASGYWDPIRGDELAAGVDLVTLDYAFNSGPKKANWERLKVVASLGSGASVAALITTICEGRLSFMHSLSSWKYFGKGWGRRVAACEATALQMARVPLKPVLEAAKAKKQVVQKRATKIVAGGGAAAGGSAAGSEQHLISGGWWIAGIILGCIVLALILTAFLAWRQGQRAEALEAAIKNMAEQKELQEAALAKAAARDISAS